MGDSLAKRLQPVSELGAQGASHSREEMGHVLIWLSIAVIKLMTKSSLLAFSALACSTTFLI